MLLLHRVKSIAHRVGSYNTDVRPATRTCNEIPMDLSLELPGDYLVVRRADAHAVTVNDRELTTSFVLTRDRLIEDWPVFNAADFGLAQAQILLDLQPQVVLLGTGAQQIFPPAETLAACLRRGVGVEVMDNAAAARTHALLVGEERKVATAFILTPR